MQNTEANKLKTAHLEISRRISGLDFNGIWPGFHIFPFALYDDKTVCFGDSEIPWDSGFIGNTSIKYNGAWTAIWKFTDPARDIDSLAACIVHEMFHAWQDETGGLPMADMMVGAFYPRDLRNFELRHAENLALAALHGNFETGRWGEFKALRSRRRAEYPEAVEFDVKTENQEGSATYAELRTLKYLNPGIYLRQLEKRLASLRSPEKVFDARLISYTSGAVLHHLRLEHSLAPADCAGAPGLSATALPAIPALGVEHGNYFGAIDRLVVEKLAGAEKLKLQDAELTGFDPYNVRASGEYLYHPHFIAVSRGEKPAEFMMGPHITKMRARTRQIAEVWRPAPEKIHA